MLLKTTPDSMSAKLIQDQKYHIQFFFKYYVSVLNFIESDPIYFFIQKHRTQKLSKFKHSLIGYSEINYHVKRIKLFGAKL